MAENITIQSRWAGLFIHKKTAIVFLLIFTSSIVGLEDKKSIPVLCETNSATNSCYKKANVIFSKLWKKYKLNKLQQTKLEYARLLFFQECRLGPKNQWFRESCYNLFLIRDPDNYTSQDLKKIFGFQLIDSYHLSMDGPGDGFYHSFRSSINNKCYLWEPGNFSEIDCFDVNPEEDWMKMQIE